MKDFFISYNQADRQWAVWIAWQLEEAGYSVIIQEWDFRPGSNFVSEMQKASVGTKRTIAVLSDAYLNSLFTQAEWAAAFAEDPRGNNQKLLPVKVQDCEPPGLLKAIIQVTLFGMDEAMAKEELLGALKERDKPAIPPVFPGGVAPGQRKVKEKPPFPIAVSLVQQGSVRDERDTVTSQQPIKSYLMIRIEPKPSNGRRSKKYFVKAWFIVDEQKYQVKSGAGSVPLAISEDEQSKDTAEKAFTITEIKKLIPIFIRNSNRQHPYLTDFTIELFLPDELLNESVDSWNMDDGDSVFPIGSRYQIILRSSQRLDPEKFNSNGRHWRKKWNNMPEPGAKRSADLLVAGDNMSFACLFQELEQTHIMGLTFVENSLQIGKNSPMAALRSTGAPIAMWLRQPLPNVNQTTIDSLLKCCLHDLPLEVKRYRLAAFSQKSGSHIGHHLALLWDSFDRLPPGYGNDDFTMS